MKLSDLFTSNNQSSVKQTGETENLSTSDAANKYRVSRQIRGLTAGQTLQGEVVSKSGNDLVIKIGDNAYVNARMDYDMNVEPGKIMTFEVRNNQGNTLALTPLFENMGTDANVLKALEMANLPVNNTTVSMAETMMEEGMSIGKNSLQAMFKQVAANGGDSVSVVQLSKLGIEITPKNVEQLQNYKNLEHQLIKDMTNILDEIPMQFETMISQGDKGVAVEFYGELLQLFTGSKEIPPETMNQTGVAGEPAEIMVTQGMITQEMEVQELGFQETISPETLSQETTSPEVILQENIPPKTEPAPTENTQVLSLGERQELAQVMQELGVPKESLELLKDGTQSVANTLQNLIELITAEDGKMVAGSELLFAKEGFKKLLQSAITRQWLIAPKDVESPDKVQALYERVSEQLKGIKEAIANTVKADAPIAKSVNNLGQNIDFMNQMNQLYTYIQLPLKMSGQNAHGDLYVYTNKKSLAKAEGNVSALLHLDMEHLGPVDVYVAMQNERVNTHFYLQDDEMLSFIEAHISILNDRLEKRGYSMQCEMSVKEEQTKVIDEILEADKNHTVMAAYSFDVRA